jgi:hypothetical protein
MNSLVEEELPLRDSQHLRYYLIEILTDADLAYKLPGDNPTLGELCREIGELEHRYIQSFKTLKHDWSYQNPDRELANSTEQLKIWYRALDDEFDSILSALTEDELHNRHIDRGHGFTPSLFVQFHIYREAVLMFYAKASVYLKALQKPVNDQWRIGVG